MSSVPAADSIGLREVTACPLCGSAFFQMHSNSPPNLYSEKLAMLAGIDETELIECMPNLECRDCGLIYKRRWFPESALQELFLRGVPDHPKGWDAVSDRFSGNNFFAELYRYEQALAEGDEFGSARWRRALLSIIDSIPELQHRTERTDIENALQSGDCAGVRRHESLICASMNSPAPFKRFSGFRSEAMWHWCEQRVGRIDAYAEVGCPLWGMLPIASAQGRRVSFLSRSEPNYWAGACRRDGQTCSARMQSACGVEVRPWDNVPKVEYTLIGAFQYLDHLEAPLAFMDQVFQRARSCALILDRFSQPPALQHLTGWTDRAIAWLADCLGKQVYDGFEPIRSSENCLYLLSDPA